MVLRKEESRNFVNKVMNLAVPYKTRNFLISWTSLSLKAYSTPCICYYGRSVSVRSWQHWE
jgi:hypothetical protein